MAKQRSINTKMRSDSFFEKLDPSEKLLFVYLLTNMYTNICGIYEIPLKIVAVETGLDKEMVIKILNRFEKDNKILHIDGYICIVNFIKNQSNNPSVIKGIERELKLISKEILQKISLRAGPTFTGSIQAVGLNLTKLNLTKPNETESDNDKETEEKEENNKSSVKQKKEINIPFEEFRNLYDNKKGDKRKCDKMRKELTDIDRINIIENIPRFKQIKPFANYTIPFPSTYLNQRRWENDLKDNGPDYEKLDQFDKQMSIDVQPIKDFFSKKYGPERQVKYSEMKQLWKQSPLYLK